MAGRDNVNHTQEDVARSTADIRQDIDKEGENISETIEQIGERIKEKLDWRGYVRDYPYWALGLAAGAGYLASGVFKKHPTPMEQIMNSMAEAGRESLDGLRAGAAGPSLIKVTLLGVAAKAVASWIKNNASKSAGTDGAEPQPQTAHGSTINPK